MLTKCVVHTEISWANGIVEHTRLSRKYIWYTCTFKVKILWDGPLKFTVSALWADGAILVPSQYNVLQDPNGRNHQILFTDLKLSPFGNRVPNIVVDLSIPE